MYNLSKAVLKGRGLNPIIFGQTISHPDVQASVSYRRALQLQVQRYKRAVMGEMPYEAYRKVS
ncbi:hypothetical protein IQ241_08990 [Romeria aff. gracilis LEGE 07310]|uniref:Uncharacterized protein n=2 Tax=Vasconcelosia TaxID=3366328 RepID=A0A8J7ALY9_9CYAN|nr:hypothetical protein [Romeria aff. gracilis LEGE 07310]